MHLVIGAVHREVFLAMPLFFFGGRRVSSRVADFNMADKITMLNTGTSILVCVSVCYFCARILRIGVHLTQQQSSVAAPQYGPATRISARQDPMGGILCREYPYRGIMDALELCR